MAIALVATLVLALTAGFNGLQLGLLIAAMLIGAAIGLFRAARVPMTGMPELIALFHSFVGLAAVLVGWNGYLEVEAHGARTSNPICSASTTPRSSSACSSARSPSPAPSSRGQAHHALGQQPLLLPGGTLLNLGALVAFAALAVSFVIAPTPRRAHRVTVDRAGAGRAPGRWRSAAATCRSSCRMLNSYSGWAAAAAGFMLGNDLLIITGALVGSSGAILSYIMCKAMNRSFISNVILGGFGAERALAAAGSDSASSARSTPTPRPSCCVARERDHRPRLRHGRRAGPVPGADLSPPLRKRHQGAASRIHPVAGRLPGHMNVLLAEARVPTTSSSRWSRSTTTSPTPTSCW